MGAGHTVHRRWSEFVNDLWQERLPHFRHEDGIFIFDPTTGRYGFHKGSDYSIVGEFMIDLTKMSQNIYQGDRQRVDSICWSLDIEDSLKSIVSSGVDFGAMVLISHKPHCWL